MALEEQADGWEDYQVAVKEAVHHSRQAAVKELRRSTNGTHAQTGEFVKISTGMRETEAQIAAPRPDLAVMIRTLQELEKQKLQLVCALLRALQ